MPHQLHQKVLDKNAAWQLQVIEAFGICPFARQCREQGKLWRDVLESTPDDLEDRLTAALVALHRGALGPEIPCEIGLLLCPDATADASAFERSVRRAAERATALVHAQAREPLYYAVAFHPNMAYSAADPQKLVGFWRRSPHPTVQLVHIATLQHLRNTRIPPKYVDPEDLAAVQALLGQAVTGDLADRIATANWRTYHANAAALEAKSAQLLETARKS